MACMSRFPLTLSLFPEVWPSCPRRSASSNEHEHSERFDTARKRGNLVVDGVISTWNIRHGACQRARSFEPGPSRDLIGSFAHLPVPENALTAAKADINRSRMFLMSHSAFAVRLWPVPGPCLLLQMHFEECQPDGGLFDKAIH